MHFTNIGHLFYLSQPNMPQDTLAVYLIVLGTFQLKQISNHARNDSHPKPMLRTILKIHNDSNDLSASQKNHSNFSIFGSAVSITEVKESTSTLILFIYTLMCGIYYIWA